MAKGIMAKKQGPPSLGLERRVKARKAADPEPESDESLSESENGGEGLPPDEDMSEDQDREDDSDGSEPDESASKPKMDLSSISFGALAKAQASMPSSRRKGAKRGTGSDSDSDSDSNSDQPGSATTRPSKDKKSSKTKAPKRASKHAPTEMSSKRPVSRKRDFLESAAADAKSSRPQARDPRFDPAIAHGTGGGFDEAKAQKAYAFLDEYRAGEMAALRAEAKKTKDPAEKERLKRLVMSMESKKKAAENRERERAVLEEHRKKEKDLVKQGKQPFYLKKSEQKKRMLTEQFRDMKKKQVDKVIERRRKKATAREKMELDHLERRGAGS